MLRLALLVALFTMLSAAGCKKKGTTESAVAPAAASEAPAAAASARELPEAVQKMVANFSRVFYDFDKSDLTEDGKAALTENVKIMQEHPDLRLEVQGHADERGTTDYNLALGQRRADSVLKFMEATGVSGGRVKVVSYGEERPLDNSQSERAWEQNRRCEFVILWGGTADVQGTTGTP